MSQQLVKESMEGTLSVKNSEYYYEDKRYTGRGQTNPFI